MRPRWKKVLKDALGAQPFSENEHSAGRESSRGGFDLHRLRHADSESSAAHAAPASSGHRGSRRSHKGLDIPVCSPPG